MIRRRLLVPAFTSLTVGVTTAALVLVPSTFAGSDTLGGHPASVTAAVHAPGPDHGKQWHAAWRAAPQQPREGSPSDVGMEDQTVRMVVHSDLGGRKVRVRLSNAYGAQPVHIGSVSVALRLSGPTVNRDTGHVVRFDGQRSFSIPVGHEAVSDPVPLRVRRGQDLAVSVYFPEETGPTTWHYEAEATTYLSVPGDWTTEPGGSPYQTITPS